MLGVLSDDTDMSFEKIIDIVNDGIIYCELPRKLTLDEPCLTLFGEKP